MKSLKKYTLWLVILCFMMILATAGVQAASKEVKLSRSDMIFCIGQTGSLKLENASVKSVKWKSSKKSVASVSKKGIIKAKKLGKCVITASYKGKNYKCKVSVLSDKKYVKKWCKGNAEYFKEKYKNPYDQVLAATYFIATNFEYGKARNNLEVLKKGKGTCVSANRLLATVLNEMGFKAKLRFAANDDMTRYPLGLFFMSEHHNVLVKIKGKSYYVDATPETGMIYMSTKKKPIYWEIYLTGDVMIDKVPGH